MRLVLAVVLLVLGLLVGLYSPALQDSLKDAALQYVNSRPGTMKIEVDRLRLRFPLRLQLSGLTALDRESGDTIIKAEAFYGKIDVLPLLKGDIDVSAARLINALYVQGGPDSTLYLRARIGKLDLEPVSVSLGEPMTINLENVTLAESRVSIAIRPDTLPADTASTPTQMVFKAGRLHFVDFTYDMSIAGSIDSLAVNFGDAVLADATIDLGGQTVDVTSLKGAGLSAAFVTAAATESAQPTGEEEDTGTSEPWTVNVGDIDFNGGSALYTSAGYQPEPGLDFGYISVDSLRLHITDFYNRAANIRLPISALHATERCGLTLDALGEVAIDSVGLSVNHFILTTPAGTAIKAEALMGMGDTATDATLPLEADVHGFVAPSDLATMFPAAALIASGLPDGAPVELEVLAKGTTGTLPIERLGVKINRCIELQADGTVYWPMNSEKLAADIDISGRVYNVTPLKNKLFDKALSKMLNIPPMTIDGHVGMRGNYTDGRLRVLTGKGELAGKGSWMSTTEGYSADLSLRDFPVDAFLPTYGVGRVSATAKINGRGVNPQSTRMVADADISVQSAQYGGYDYRDIALQAKLAEGHANVRLDSGDAAASFVLTAEGNIVPEPMEWSGTLEASNIDLMALKMSDAEMTLATRMDFTACLASADTTMELHVKVPAFSMRDSVGTLSTDDMAIDFVTDARYTHARFINEDLTLSLDSDMPLDTVLARVTAAQDTLAAHIVSRHLNIESLQRALPDFVLDFKAGSRNLASRYLQRSEMAFDRAMFRASNDSLINLAAGVDGLSIGKSTNIDTLRLSARQDSSRMLINMYMNNQPGTFDDFAHVKVDGYLDSDKLKLMLNQKNIDDKTGFDLGVLVTYADSTLRANFIPTDPTIGYKPWTLNADNYVSYNFPHKHLDANLHLQNAASVLELYTDHGSEHGHDPEEDGHEYEDRQEDVVLRIKDLQLSDWLAVNPFAPPVKGVVSADMRVNWSADALNGKGTVGVDSLYYGKDRVGDFLADITLSTNATGTVRAHAGLTVNGVRTVDIEGNLNDSTAVNPFNLDFSMIHFPLETVNPFLGGSAKLRGVLNGKMDITGDLKAPVFNGTLDFDSTAITVTMLGATYNFSEAYIDVVDSKVSLHDFAIVGVNKNPLLVNGTVDITNMDNAGIDLTFKARDMGLVDSKKAPKGADVYGKAFIDLDATVKGNMRYVDVDAALSLLAGTNVYYNVPDATNTIQSMQNDKMVRFVRFADSTSMADLEEVPPTMTMALDAVLNIESGTTITVNLSADGSDRLQIEPEGTLNYTQPPLSDGRLTGRLNINGGLVRYSLPVLGEKSFDFQSGSYLNFTGQLMNPALNLQAIDKVRANVTQEGQNSRLINFDVGLSVTGTLNTMNVAFDLSTTDDLTIANELQSMTAEQRASQAMNLLLYGTYTGAGVKADANMSGNALYGFLESQLNSWAANAIKGVDLSFGIDQYDRTQDGNTSTATQYSYRVSKSLFNNRFKIIVGGNYSTDANTDENFAQNLINDISFEYLLNRQGTMYVRLFRHTGYESILEGEVTQTGVGFVYRRKIRKLIDMFRPFRKYTSLTAAPVNPEVTQPSTNTATDEKTTSR